MIDLKAKLVGTGHKEEFKICKCPIDPRTEKIDKIVKRILDKAAFDRAKVTIYENK